MLTDTRAQHICCSFLVVNHSRCTSFLERLLGGVRRAIPTVRTVPFQPCIVSLAERLRKEAARSTGFSVQIRQKIIPIWCKNVMKAGHYWAEAFAGSTKELGQHCWTGLRERHKGGHWCRRTVLLSSYSDAPPLGTVPAARERCAWLSIIVRCRKNSWRIWWELTGIDGN